MSRYWNRRSTVWLSAWSLAIVLAAQSTGQAAPNQLTPQEIHEGWILLFDGATLFGWYPASKADWKAADGILSASEGEPGLLVSTSQFGNYVLKADFRSAAETNSGIFLRTPPRVRPQDTAKKCYEVNIAPTDNPFPTGSLVGRQRTEACAASGEWRGFQITADGGHFLVQLDGKTVVDYTDPAPVARGHVGLQLNQGKIEFRNIKLKPLGMTSLFNGKDLSGWKTYPTSTASVTPEGWIHLLGGKGQLESLGQFADFTLQLDVFVNASGSNSGVFFRSIPGEMWNGYESQIHNGYTGGDRTRPADCGTGGIFRRQNARKVVANDKEWFSKTIHADGNHMAVGVNGYQVSDWTDTRQLAENPRKGLRLKAGTLILQGHDPTSDFYFRNVRIADSQSQLSKGIQP
jgi:hypothetical protein